MAKKSDCTHEMYAILEEHPAGLSTSDISQQMGWTQRNKIYRVADACETEGMIIGQSDGKWYKFPIDGLDEF